MSHESHAMQFWFDLHGLSHIPQGNLYVGPGFGWQSPDNNIRILETSGYHATWSGMLIQPGENEARLRSTMTWTWVEFMMTYFNLGKMKHTGR